MSRSLKCALAIVTTMLTVGRPLAAHDWYTHLEAPTGEKCCDDHDCRPIATCVLPGQREGLMVEGLCHAIPWDKVLPVAAPDGSPHACYWVKSDVYSRMRVHFLCVILPGAA